MRSIFCLLLAVFFFAPSAVFGSLIEGTPVPEDDVFARGIVREIGSEFPTEEPNRTMILQTVVVEIISGAERGLREAARYYFDEAKAAQMRLAVGDTVIVGKQLNLDDEVPYYVSDRYRLTPLWWLLGAFVALVLALARWAGARSLIGLALSFVVILFFIVPAIARGQSPVFVGASGAIVIALATLFIAHGFRARTAIAFVGTFVTIVFAFALALWTTRFMHLFGLGSEDAFYLQFAPDRVLDLRGILIAGITIGVLGVLDDVTTAQAAVVEELHHANRSFGTRELFRRASSVGREHILAVVNTLILAYTGAALPLLLLFVVYDRPAWLMLNSELIMEEVVRMLIGSIALILAIPMTTVLAAHYFGRKKL